MCVSGCSHFPSDDGNSVQTTRRPVCRHVVRRAGGGNDVIARLAADSSHAATLQAGRTTARARTAA